MDSHNTEYSVKTFGARGNSRDDDTTAFQTAIDGCAQAGGGVVSVPTGRYRIDGTLDVARGVVLRGAGGAVDGWGSPTVLEAYDREHPFIRLAWQSGVQNLEVFYPEQRLVPDNLVEYPWTISAPGENCSVIGVSLRNSYNGIDLTRACRHLVRDVHGSPLNIGIYVDQCYDVGRIENVHFWPFNGPEAHEDFYFDWLTHHATAFVFGRTDWEYVLNTFCWGYKIGMHFVETEHGSANGQFLGVGVDAAEYCIVVEQINDHTGGVLITNGEFVPLMADDSAALVVNETNRGFISLTNCGVWGPSDNIARIAGKGRVAINGCNFIQWDKNKRDAPAIDCAGGSVTINGNHFAKSMNEANTAPHVAIREGTTSAVVSGNMSDGPWRAVNEIGERAQIGLNAGG